MEKTGSPHAYIRRLGPEVPQSPVILSVPHAGRDYPDSMMANSRLDEADLRSLEDRHVDTLVAPLAEHGYTVIIGTAARAWIDLNRSEREIDPAMIYPAPRQSSVEMTAKVRGGLGLIPQRLAGHGTIHRRAIARGDLAARITLAHRPYHACLSDIIDATRRRFGIALLLDCHSMPPLRVKHGTAPAKIVIGDRHGESAAPVFSTRAVEICRGAGFQTAINTPYAGGHILARHSRPERDVHGLQLEICRSLYLDRAHDQPGHDWERITALIGRLADRLEEECLSPPSALAAE